jgi:sulfate/thiosulfate-binding protein
MRTTPLALSALAAACSSEAPTPDAAAPVTRHLVLAAYTTPREVLGERVIPAFQDHWRAQTGETVEVETSFQASGAQSRAVEAGLEADVVWFSLGPDVQRLVDAGLVTHDVSADPGQGIVSSSLVVIGVRPGNPKGIADWADLGRDGVEVLTPNVRTSGGAMWNVLAVVGAAQRGHGGGADAEALLGGVLANTRVMDKGARESMLTFESGVGDAIVTYENEIVVARRAGKAIDLVMPSSTIVIENPAVVVDTYADRHSVRDVADAFVAFLRAPEQQAAMVEYGLRPVVDGVDASAFPAASDTFRVSDLGGWAAVKASVFEDGALYDRAAARGRAP